jgi:hypothetical protein
MTADDHPANIELAAFAAGTLDDARRMAVADHVRGCARCRAFVRAMEHVGGFVLEGLPPAALAGGSLAAVMAQFDSPAPQFRPASDRARFAGSAGLARRWSGRPTHPSRRLRIALASAALIVLSLGITYFAGDALFNYIDDFPASTATTGMVAVGGSTRGNIETVGDADWFRVTLTSGKNYQFACEGSDAGHGTLQYPVLRLIDGAGQVLVSDSGSVDGPGPGWTSVLIYVAPSTGTYHVSAEGHGKHTGTYRIRANEL